MLATEENIIDLLEKRILQIPDAPLYSFLDRNLDTHRTLSYADVYSHSRQIAAALQKRRICNVPVILLYPQGADFIFSFFGAILAGAWPVPLVKARGQDWESVFKLISITGADTILTTAAKGTLIPESLLSRHDVALICTDEPDVDTAPEVTAEWQRPLLRGDDIAFIQYTSGSISRPKGVIVTHENILHNSELIRRNFNLTPDDVVVSWLPFHHDMGLIGHVIQAMYSSFHNYFLRPADFLTDPLRWLTAISRYGATVSGGPNFAYDMCASRIQPAQIDEADLDLRRWRLAYCGSERIVAQTLYMFADSLRGTGFSSQALYPCYGMAESTLFVCGQHGITERQTASEPDAYPAVGTIDDPYSVAIVDPRTATPLMEGAVGEIWLRSPSISPGYFRDSLASAETFGQIVQEGRGYMRTGDIGFMRSGSLHFVGRLKNLIKRRGRSYFCEDIEVVIETAFKPEGVLRCAAFEIHTAHAQAAGAGNNDSALIIFCEYDFRNSTPGLPQAIAARVCDVVGIVVSDVVLLNRNSLPLTTSGKLQRSICKDLYLKGLQNRKEYRSRHDTEKDYTT